MNNMAVVVALLLRKIVIDEVFGYFVIYAGVVILVNFRVLFFILFSRFLVLLYV